MSADELTNPTEADVTSLEQKLTAFRAALSDAEAVVLDDVLQLASLVADSDLVEVSGFGADLPPPDYTGGRADVELARLWASQKRRLEAMGNPLAAPPPENVAQRRRGN